MIPKSYQSYDMQQDYLFTRDLLMLDKWAFRRLTWVAVRAQGSQTKRSASCMRQLFDISIFGRLIGSSCLPLLLQGDGKAFRV